MPDPVTMGLAINTGLQIATSLMGSSMESAQLKANARIAKARAKTVELIGENDAQNAERRGERAAAYSRAVLASRGVQLDEGTALEIPSQIIKGAIKDSVMVRIGAQDRAFQLRQGATIDEINARIAKTTGGLKAATALTQGYTDIKTWNT